ncbi:hypothetical protein JCM10908_003884 [Rhodotorula pacifica]|uniref:heat shock factor family protein n=1 Tax=Rhodotorula pacifica TaxID=1495444 RepID=UPI00316D7C0E
MQREGSGRDLAAPTARRPSNELRQFDIDLLRDQQQEQSAAASEIAVSSRQAFHYGATHAYTSPDATTHVYSDYASHAECVIGPSTMQGGGGTSAEQAIPPHGEDGHHYYPQPHPVPYFNYHAFPHPAHEFGTPDFLYDQYRQPYQHHHGTVFASVESARWISEPDSAASSSAGHLPDSSWQMVHHAPQASQLQPSADPSSGAQGGSQHRRRHSSGLVAADPAAAMGGEALEDDGTGNEIKPFVYKIFAMLSEPERYQDVILWDHVGEAFFVAHNDRFVNEVLREQFQHGNIHSFTRQLNVYQFQRYTVAQLRSALDLSGTVASTYSGWTHPNFRRGRPDLLHLLTPRPSRARLIRKLEKQYSHTKSPRVFSVPPPPGSSSSSSSQQQQQQQHPQQQQQHLAPGRRRSSSAGGSSSQSSLKAESDSTTSPPTSSHFLPLPLLMEMATYPQQHYLSPQALPPQALVAEPMYPSPLPQYGRDQQQVKRERSD